jgi:hypothetical protein
VTVSSDKLGRRARRLGRGRQGRVQQFLWVGRSRNSLATSWGEAWSRCCRRKVSGPLSRNDVRAIAAWHCVSRPMSRRLNDIGAAASWGYVSGPLSRNDIRAVTAWDCVGGPLSWGLYNVALRLSRAYECKHCCYYNDFLHNAPPC